MNKFLDSIGFDSTQALIDSTLHPTTLIKVTTISSVFAVAGSFFEDYIGVAPITAIVIFVLFVLELFTGVKASKKEGHKFESRKFQKGFIKLFLYLIMIGSAHLLSKNMSPKPVFGFSFNVYEWLHYFFLNFTILQFFISNIENFRRLGWSEFVPALDKIGDFLNIKKSAEKIELEEDEED